MTCSTLGILTLGQAPREDIIPTFKSILGAKVDYLQAGALDGLSLQNIAFMKADAEERGIETRLLSGQPILVKKEILLDKLKDKGTTLEKRCDIVLLLCSGRFPELKLSHPAIIQPIDFLQPAVKAVAQAKRLCIIGPESDMDQAAFQWRGCAQSVTTAPASPYGTSASLWAAAMSAKESGADLIFMDDMGFSEVQKNMVREYSGISTMNATSMSARLISELF